MFSKKHQLKAKDFRQVLKEGKSFREDVLLLKIKKNNLRKNRIGFLISKRISKKAVLRNKIKRRLKTVVEQRIKNFLKGLDLVFIGFPGIEKKKIAEIEKLVEKIFIKAKILK